MLFSRLECVILKTNPDRYLLLMQHCSIFYIKRVHTYIVTESNASDHISNYYFLLMLERLPTRIIQLCYAHFFNENIFHMPISFNENEILGSESNQLTFVQFHRPGS